MVNQQRPIRDRFLPLYHLIRGWQTTPGRAGPGQTGQRWWWWMGGHPHRPGIGGWRAGMLYRQPEGVGRVAGCYWAILVGGFAACCCHHRMCTINSQCLPGSAQYEGSGAALPLSGIGPLVERQRHRMPHCNCPLLYCFSLTYSRLHEGNSCRAGQGQGGQASYQELVRYYTPLCTPVSNIPSPPLPSAGPYLCSSTLFG